MDEDSLSAAMLHDVMEDSGIPKSVIEKKFNLQLKNETRFGLWNLNIDLFNKNNQL